MAGSKCFPNTFLASAEFKALRASAKAVYGENTAFLKYFCKVSASPLTTSLLLPPVTTSGQPPSKNSKTATPKRKKGESVAERSVTEGTLAISTALLSSQNLCHLSSSRKDDISIKGQTTSVGDNTPIAGVVPPAKDPSQLSSNTAPAVNVSTKSQVGIQAETSASDDPLAKTQADDDEEATTLNINNNNNSLLADIPFPITHHQIPTATQHPSPTSILADIPFPTPTSSSIVFI